MVLLEVYDLYGNKTKEVLDKDKIHELGLYHKEVAIIIINNKKQILLQKRSSKKKIEPNKWAWHGGHVNTFESDIDAIIRETKEGLGIEIIKENIKPLVSLRRDKLPNRQFTQAYYTFYDYDINELAEVKWIDYKEFKNMIFFIAS